MFSNAYSHFGWGVGETACLVYACLSGTVKYIRVWKTINVLNDLQLKKKNFLNIIVLKLSRPVSAILEVCTGPVSYTHLDVYKRQEL